MEPIEFGEFLKRTGFAKKSFMFPNVRKIEKVVALRDIRHVLFVSAMSTEYLTHLLRQIGLVGDSSKKVYADANIRRLRIDPNGLYLGQRYVYRPNYTAIMENFKDLFSAFTLPRGLSKLTPQIVFGKDNNGEYALAHYVSPIFELHGGKLIILDGVHRDFIVKNAGTTIEGILIEHIDVPFPCAPQHWDAVSVIDTKPEKIEDRYFGLKKELFRDLKSIGIDG